MIKKIASVTVFSIALNLALNLSAYASGDMNVYFNNYRNSAVVISASLSYTPYLNCLTPPNETDISGNSSALGSGLACEMPAASFDGTASQMYFFDPISGDSSVTLLVWDVDSNKQICNIQFGFNGPAPYANYNTGNPCALDGATPSGAKVNYGGLYIFDINK